MKSGDNIVVHYVGKLDDGTLFDSTVERDPLQFTVGKGQVIPGFDEAVIGMNPGESRTVCIPPEQSYGPYYDELIMVIDRAQLPTDLELEIGMYLEIRHEDGRSIFAVVADIAGPIITLDANHPLAGQTLTFSIRLVEIL